jgi:hypothetical protein
MLSIKWNEINYSFNHFLVVYFLIVHLFKFKLSGAVVVVIFGSWIYNYLCNQCLSPPRVRVQIPLMVRCTQYHIMWKSLSVTCDRSVVFSGFLHLYNWRPWYNWNIVEIGVMVNMLAWSMVDSWFKLITIILVFIASLQTRSITE